MRDRAEGGPASRHRDGFEAAERELRALLDEVAEVDWQSPVFRGFVAALATSEVLARRTFSAEAAASAFVTALEANSALAADTFMASHAEPPPGDAAGRARLAVVRAQRTVSVLRALDAAAPEQPLEKALALRGGWLRPHRLSTSGPATVAFVLGERACLARIDPDAVDASLVHALERWLAKPDQPGEGLRLVTRADAAPTPAAAAIALEPVSLRMARSFHRFAWTEGGGPWMGVADCPPYAVVSTCHAAVDGYAHARITGAILRAGPRASSRIISPGVANARLDAPLVGFATHRLDGPPPRFASAVHAFATVLDRHLGGDPNHSAPFHVPIAPGARDDATRWRARPLYGLCALQKRDGELESLDDLAARLPSFLAREASGRGILTRVLRATLELPLSDGAVRRLISRAAWADRLFPPARILTGSGYISWMRFPPGEAPPVPTFPSAVPSFSDDAGGAGLSIAPFAGGLAIGLTTSGRLGTVGAAEGFLEEWVDELARGREGRQHTA